MTPADAASAAVAATTRTRRDRRFDGLPLRWTLVVAVVVLAALGLAASGTVVTSALRSSLVERTDRDLAEALGGWARPLGDPDHAPPPGAPEGEIRPPTAFFLRVTARDGTVVRQLDDLGVVPDLPADLGTTPATVPSTDRDLRWRAASFAAPDGNTVVVALPLSDVDATVDRLVALELVVGAVVLAILAVLAYGVVRRSLRHLVDVEHAAAAIAGGDLYRTIPEADHRTEVGRLSVALNAMLGQIRSAFAASEEAQESARRSADAARGSEDRMRRFVADAAHELRTPLTSIRGFAELSRHGGLDSAAALARIEAEAQRMGLLVEDLVMLARLDAERPVLRNPVDLLVIAADAVRAARAAAPGRVVDLEVAGAPVVLGDDARLRQVVGNLLTNARVHTPPTARVTVRVRVDGHDAIVEVADTGPGLADTERARVFERFYRADASRSRSSGGSGLGLSIVAALVAAHDGRVEVDSTPGVGSVFRVVLPSAHAEADPDGSEVVPDSDPTEPDATEPDE